MAPRPDEPGQSNQNRAAQNQDRARGTEGARGQDKVYEVTNPTTGETRTVTQRQWREERLGQAGWEKPADMPEDDTTSV